MRCSSPGRCTSRSCVPSPTRPAAAATCSRTSSRTWRSCRTASWPPPCGMPRSARRMQPDFLKNMAKLSDGILAATMWDAAVGKAVPWIAKENERHVAKFGAPFTEDSAGYYQAFQIIVDALERAKTTSARELRDAIAATSITDVNHKAMFLPYKALRFDDTGQNPFATAMVVQIQGGKFRLLYPESIAEPDARVVWPYLATTR